MSWQYRRSNYRRSLSYNYQQTRTEVSDITNKVDDPSLKDRIEKLQQNEEIKDNEWLKSFLSSILEQFTTKGYLTQNQINRLEINEKQYSKEKLEEDKQWQNEYDEEKRIKAKKAANYYKFMHEENGQPFYYQSIAEKVLQDDNYIPPQNQYKKMVENTYVKSWIALSESKPKYAVGDYVSLNAQSNNYYTNRNNHKEIQVLKQFEIGCIIEIKPPKFNRKGGHVCVVLPMGGTELVEIEERLLKKAKGV